MKKIIAILAALLVLIGTGMAEYGGPNNSAFPGGDGYYGGQYHTTFYQSGGFNPYNLYHWYNYAGQWFNQYVTFFGPRY
jgi:hypothetical protein